MCDDREYDNRFVEWPLSKGMDGQPTTMPTKDGVEAQKLHYITQRGQPYGSVRRCCNWCGVMVGSGEFTASEEEWKKSPNRCSIAGQREEAANEIHIYFPCCGVCVNSWPFKRNPKCSLCGSLNHMIVSKDDCQNCKPKSADAEVSQLISELTKLYEDATGYVRTIKTARVVISTLTTRISELEKGRVVTDEDGDEYESELDMWLTKQVLAGKGVITMCVTEKGDIGVFFADQETAAGTGDTAFEALTNASRLLEGRQ